MEKTTKPSEARKKIASAALEDFLGEVGTSSTADSVGITIPQNDQDSPYDKPLSLIHPADTMKSPFDEDPNDVATVAPPPVDMSKILNLKCKSAGIEPFPEYHDILVRNAIETGGIISERDIDMFILGITTDRHHSIFTNISDMAVKLETSLKLVSNLERKIQERSIKEESTIATEIKKISSKMDILMEIPKNPPALKKEDPDEEWVNPKTSQKVDIVKISYLEASNKDYSHYPPPVITSDIYPNAAVYLGWTENVGISDNFVRSYKALPKGVRYAMYYKEMSEEGKKEIQRIMVENYKKGKGKIEEKSAADG